MSAAEPDRRAVAALRDLLLLSFNESELLRFVVDEFGHALRHELPSGGAMVDLTDGMIAAWVRRGLVGEGLFAALQRARPARANEILAVARLWRSGPELAAPAAAASRVREDQRLGLSVRLAGESIGWQMLPSGALELGRGRFTDPCVEMLLLNRGGEPVVVFAIGAQVELRERLAVGPELCFPADEFRPARITVFDVITLEFPPWATTACEVRAELADPVLVPANAALRYKVGLVRLLDGFDQRATVRLYVALDDGVACSPAFVVSSG